MLNSIVNFLILVLLEIILCLDNVVFLILVSQKLPVSQQALARKLGLFLAVLIRIALLGGAYHLTRLTQPLFSIFFLHFSWSNLLMLGGGIFLIIQTLKEIKWGKGSKIAINQKSISFLAALIQILVLDTIFSLDNIFTAVALTRHYEVMVSALIAAMLVMVLASERVNYFIQRYQRIKLLAILSVGFIGLLLVLRGFSIKIPEYFIYLILGGVALLILPPWQRLFR